MKWQHIEFIEGNPYICKTEKELKSKYGNKNEIEVWKFKNDDYYDRDNKDVVECYGI